MPVPGGAFLRFCIVGVAGFIADAGLTLLLTQLAQMAALPARILAFILAATLTWLLNRRFTFRSSAGASSWVPYVVATSLGALLNVGVFWLWLRMAGESASTIVVGVAVGSLAAMGFNYLVSRAIFVR